MMTNKEEQFVALAEVVGRAIEGLGATEVTDWAVDSEDGAAEPSMFAVAFVLNGVSFHLHIASADTMGAGTDA